MLVNYYETPTHIQQQSHLSNFYHKKIFPCNFVPDHLKDSVKNIFMKMLTIHYTILSSFPVIKAITYVMYYFISLAISQEVLLINLLKVIFKITLLIFMVLSIILCFELKYLPNMPAWITWTDF